MKLLTSCGLTFVLSDQCFRSLDLEGMGKVSWKSRRKDRVIKGESSCEEVCAWRAQVDMCTVLGAM